MQTKRIQMTSHQLVIFRKINKLIDKKVHDCIKIRPNYQLLQTQFNKTVDKQQTFKCKVCGTEFKKVHQRSAHMNKHRKLMKEQAREREKESENECEESIKKNEQEMYNEESEYYRNQDGMNHKQLVDQILDGCS